MVTRQRFMAWVFASAALMALGAFGPWVNALGASVSGTDGNNDGWFVVAAAGLGALLFYSAREKRSGGVWALLAGAAGLAVTLYDRNNVQNAINQGGAFTQALAHVGWGLNLALVASASMALAGLVWQMGLKNAAEAPAAAPPASPSVATASPLPPSE